MKFMVGSEKFEAETTYSAFKIAEKIMVEKGWKELRLMMYSVISEGWESVGRIIIPEVQKDEQTLNKENLEIFKRNLEVSLDIICLQIEKNVKEYGENKEFYTANNVMVLSQKLAQDSKELARLEAKLHVTKELLKE